MRRTLCGLSWSRHLTTNCQGFDDFSLPIPVDKHQGGALCAARVQSQLCVVRRNFSPVQARITQQTVDGQMLTEENTRLRPPAAGIYWHDIPDICSAPVVAQSIKMRRDIVRAAARHWISPAQVPVPPWPPRRFILRRSRRSPIPRLNSAMPVSGAGLPP